METFICSSCSKVISISDFTTGTARQRDGRLYCLNCLIGAKHINRVTCSQCNHYDAPLFDGKIYLCRKCGADLGMGEQELPRAGGVKTAEPSPRAGSQKKCPYCAEFIPVEAVVCGHCNSSLRGSHALPAVPEGRPTTTAAMVLFSLGLLLSLVLAIFALVSSHRRTEEGGNGEKANAVGENLEAGGKWGKATMSELDGEVKTLSQQLGDLRDSLSPSVAKMVGEEWKGLKGQVDNRLERTDEQIQGMEAAIRDLKAEQKQMAEKLSKEVPAASSEASRPSVSDASIPASKSPEADTSFAAFTKADDEASNYYKTFEYGKAIRSFDSFITVHPASPYVEWAVKKKKWYEDAAKELYETYIKVQAESHLRDNKLEQAMKCYEKAIAFGVPEVSQEAQKESAKISALKAQRTRESIKFGEEKETKIEEVREATRPGETAENAEVGGARMADQGGSSAEENKLPMDVEQLVRLIEDEITSPSQRSRAVRALGEMKGQDSLAALVGLLKNPDWSVQLEAVKALGKQPDMTVVDALLEMLDHKVLPVKQASLDSLRFLTRADQGNRKEAWKDWWAQNRERLGVPAQDNPAKGRLNLPAATGGSALAAEGKQAMVLAVSLEKNSLIFSCTGLNPLPKKGETLTVVRGKQWMGKIEVTEMGPGVGRAVIAEPLPGQAIQVNDLVVRD